MRVFAWFCVVAGLVIGSISVSYATYETTTREAIWIRCELSSQNAARLRRLIRDIDEEVRPAGVIVSPWPGVVAGAGVSAFGILLLAIRRPEKVLTCDRRGRLPLVTLEAARIAAVLVRVVAFG